MGTSIFVFVIGGALGFGFARYLASLPSFDPFAAPLRSYKEKETGYEFAHRGEGYNEQLEEYMVLLMHAGSFKAREGRSEWIVVSKNTLKAEFDGFYCDRAGQWKPIQS